MEGGQCFYLNESERRRRREMQSGQRWSRIRRGDGARCYRIAYWSGSGYIYTYTYVHIYTHTAWHVETIFPLRRTSKTYMHVYV